MYILHSIGFGVQKANIYRGLPVSFLRIEELPEPMSMSIDAFTRHPATVGETYGEHLAFASGIGGRLVLAGLACLVHGIFPFLFERTGSRTIIALHARVTGGARARLATTAIEAKPAH